jgi:hypothetical protein
VTWHPSLSSIERKTDLPQDGPRPVTDTQRREDAMSKAGSIGGGDCWCGEPYQHDWPGKDTRMPHPRTAP